jgi:hypothetical protein
MLLEISIGHFRIQYFSKLMKFIAKAAIPDAEEATCGNVFCVDCKMIVFRKGK